MATNTILIIAIILLGGLALGVIIYLVMSGKKESNLDSLMSVSRSQGIDARAVRSSGANPNLADDDIAGLTEHSRRRYKTGC